MAAIIESTTINILFVHFKELKAKTNTAMPYIISSVPDINIFAKYNAPAVITAPSRKDRKPFNPNIPVSAFSKPSFKKMSLIPPELLELEDDEELEEDDDDCCCGVEDTL